MLKTGIGACAMSEASSFSIRKLNGQAKAVLESDVGSQMFRISGLVRGVPHVSKFGHIHFYLEEDKYSIRCFLHESNHGKLGFTVSKDMELELVGTLSFYDREARLSLDIEEATLIQRSLFDVNNSETVERLRKEGLYPPKKKKLPKQIKRIGLVTSKHSDAKDDFEQTYREEAAGNVAPVDLIDVHVQGQSAPQEIADAINRLNLEADVDVIVLTRGGGAKRDLAAFNDYLIAAAISRSQIPVVTGIGHHGDETLADIMADQTARTPTQAAHLLVHGSGGASTPAAIGEKWIPYVAAAIAIVIVILIIMLLF
jgi:exodeoxyribonuclease VII large subunit